MEILLAFIALWLILSAAVWDGTLNNRLAIVLAVLLILAVFIWVFVL